MVHNIQFYFFMLMLVVKETLNYYYSNFFDKSIKKGNFPTQCPCSRDVYNVVITS